MIIDILFALILIVPLTPILLIIAIAIKLESKGPVLFKQKRLGKDKSYFYILKFRTMRIDTPHDMPTHLLVDSSLYITKVGGFLRKSSLDELPQIFNILSGQMSFIGPRPALWNQEDLIAVRDEVGANQIKPGLTGWAQVNGRDELEISVKAQYDGEYAKNMNLILDLKIIWLTIKNVILSKGVVEGQQIAQERKIS
uniref:sugar transferase n=1 Tax=Cellulosilyticum ruminicola TaxID=425254 RepID=UPI0006D0B895